MNRRILQSFVTAGLLLLAGSRAQASDPKPEPKGTPVISRSAQGRAAKAKAAAAIKPVDLNSASKDELKKLPGINEATADKIIAARPFLTKAQLVTRNLVPPMVYETLKQHVIAKQAPKK